MQRRNFVKTATCLACTFALTSCCKYPFLLNSNPGNNCFPEEFLKNIEKEKFYYKSKKDLPKRIGLEACSLCQLNCVKCPTRKLEKNAPKNWLGYLKFKDFKKFVDDNDFEIIELSSRGEIFLNPELDKIIKYAHKKRIKLTANTGVNLNTVSEQTLENLVKYKFHKMTISIDGTTPEIYKIYRRGGDFNTVIDNIKTINKFKMQYNSEFPKLTWQFIVFGHNEHEIEPAKKKAQELGMEIDFIQNLNPEYSPIINETLVKKITNIANEDKQEQLQRKFEKNKGDFFPCSKIFGYPKITHDGYLMCDCPIKIETFGVNVFKQDFLSALNSPNIIYAKKMLTDFSVQPINEIMCAHCGVYRFLRKTNRQMNR